MSKDMLNLDTRVMEVIERILDIEGRVFHHDPDDIGGETLCGISRVAYPDLEVWGVVDKLHRSGVNDTEIVNRTMRYIVDFYKGIWDRYQLSSFDIRISEELFDQVINPGPRAMATNAQRVVNALNYRNSSGNYRLGIEDLEVDGKYGPKTIAGILAIQHGGLVDEMVFSLNALQLEYYIRSTEQRTIHRKYFLGWIRHRCM